MKSTLLTCAATLLLLCGCYTQQQPAFQTAPGPAWIYDSDPDALGTALLKAATISLTQYTQHEGKTTKRTIPLNRQEQETLKTILQRAQTVKNYRKPNPPRPKTRVGVICTDAQGKCLFDEEVRIVPERVVSEEGYTLMGNLSLPDAYYVIWKRIILRKKPAPAQQTAAAAKAEHQQAVATLHQQLKDCKNILIRGQSNVVKSAYHRDLSELETKQLCALLRRAKPVPVAGCFDGVREREMYLILLDAAGKEIGKLPANSITDAASARHAEQCYAIESMYLSAADYKRLQEFFDCP